MDDIKYEADKEYIFSATFDEDCGLMFFPTGESIVRCKDCKWYCESDCYDSYATLKTCSYSLQNEGSVYFVQTSENDYCSKGERREYDKVY